MKKNIKIPNSELKIEKKSFAIKPIQNENNENKKIKLISSKFYLLLIIYNNFI